MENNNFLKSRKYFSAQDVRCWRISALPPVVRASFVGISQRFWAKSMYFYVDFARILNKYLAQVDVTQFATKRGHAFLDAGDCFA